MLALDAAAASTAAALRCGRRCSCHWSWSCFVFISECERIVDLLCCSGGCSLLVSHARFLSGLRWRCCRLRCSGRRSGGSGFFEVVHQRASGAFLRLRGSLQEQRQSAAAESEPERQSRAHACECIISLASAGAQSALRYSQLVRRRALTLLIFDVDAAEAGWEIEREGCSGGGGGEW